MLVIKVGGRKGLDYDAVCADVAKVFQGGQQLILVHGGSYQTNVVAQQLGHPPQFVTSVSGYVSRRTDRRTLEIFEMVYCGKMNKSIVESLQKHGVNAVGLSGIDGRLLEGKRKSAIKVVIDGRKRVLRDDYTGTVVQVNTELLHLLLSAGYLPVISPLAISFESEAMNVDGDRAAAAIASHMNAEQLIILSNVPGLLREFPDESTLIRHIPAAQVEKYMSYAEGRMKKKVMGAAEAVQQGVGRVVFADARVADPVRSALSGNGTVIE
ncbi:MAG: [LysW]-aminoadipate kinase [Anaerolineae bacterium]|nr:[LysW]-aminoadipate kinase [Anaerolineae bacterium]